ncbi:MAG: WHG domain-containing protein, partial [Candidatus Rokubacteria bacterium]|nr:WHG domain-containing protein [Candidatus Rokubacteria bacterium]
AHFRVMFGREIADKSAHPDLLDAAAVTFGLLVEGLAGCQRAGLAREGDPAELAISAWAAVHGLSALLLDGQLGPWDQERVEQLAHGVTASLFLGLGPQRA